MRPPNEPADAREAGYYWVLTDDGGDAPEICEWCPHWDGSGYWWAIAAGAYEDSPRIAVVLSGPLKPPAPDQPRVRRSEPGGYAEPTLKERK